MLERLVDHNYMQGVLEAYGFSPKCKNWFKVLNKNLKANILVNGFTMESLNKEQSVKQGDALSCSLFILCMDPQIRKVNRDNPVFTHYTSARRRIGEDVKYEN